MIFNVLNSKFTESRLKYLEEKERLKYFNISDYITFNSGFTAGEDSFMMRSGDTIELYLVINGTFTAGTTPHVCTINRLRPYATKTARIFPLVLNNSGWTSNAYINVYSGYVSAIIPNTINGETQVILNAVYTVSALQ